MDRISRAIELATQAHEDQPYGAHPYIAHPLDVGMSLLWAGATEPQVIAGLLHDTVEDTTVTLATIVRLFGHHIGATVAQLTHLPDISYRDYVSALHGDAAVVKVFDSACNLLRSGGLPVEKLERVRPRYQRTIAHHIAAVEGLSVSWDMGTIFEVSVETHPNGWRDAA